MSMQTSNDLDDFVTEVQDILGKEKCYVCGDRVSAQCARCRRYICRTHSIDIGDWLYHVALCPECWSEESGRLKSEE